MNLRGLGARLALPAVLLATATIGCGGGGPELSPVSGTVTLDGKPLSGAKVVFEPETGRASVGETDDSGRYEMQYTADKPGALAGSHRVLISTYRPADPDMGIEEERPEKIPTKYNSATTLAVDVPGASDAFDFALDSQGEIVQPGRARGPWRDTD